MEKAYFAAGCFWGVESIFKKIKGVKETTVGYCGGHTENPTYHQVCSNTTGHAESIEIIFDPSIVSFQKLLETFWTIHDPTQVNRQGPDVGSQYRSAIFYTNKKQKEVAEKSKTDLEKSNKFSSPISTEIIKFDKFWPAEDYHQDYEEKHGIGLC
jgi:peptide-methionine (S)-S-oxide reductase